MQKVTTDGESAIAPAVPELIKKQDHTPVQSREGKAVREGSREGCREPLQASADTQIWKFSALGNFHRPFFKCGKTIMWRAVSHLRVCKWRHANDKLRCSEAVGSCFNSIDRLECGATSLSRLLIHLSPRIKKGFLQAADMRRFIDATVSWCQYAALFIQDIKHELWSSTPSVQGVSHRRDENKRWNTLLIVWK